MDGTTSGSNYKQAFSSAEIDDTYIFSSFMCPLSLTEKSTNAEIFTNHSPGDERKCRPLSIQFEKESNSLTESTYASIQEELMQTPYIMVPIGAELVKVNITAHPTMMDGKCLNVLLENNASQRCRGCSETYKTFKGIFFSYNTTFIFNFWC